jgi:uncharacterized membrane protein
MRYLYVFSTLLLTVFGQILLKWRISKLHFTLPNEGGIWAKFRNLLCLVFDSYILIGFFAAFLASLCWMAAMTKFQLSEAYPFMSLSPAIVFITSIWLLNETFTFGKVIGLVLIILGTIVTVKF